MKTLNLATTIHGRVLVREAADPVAVVVGFHGYMESAEIQMQRLEALPGSERWTLIAVQGLHRFYKGRSQEVVAGWMTRQDREDMIADNIEYADRVDRGRRAGGCAAVHDRLLSGRRDGVSRRRPRDGDVRAGSSRYGGDVPPELLADAAVMFPAVLLARGEGDEWYTGREARRRRDRAERPRGSAAGVRASRRARLDAGRRRRGGAVYPEVVRRLVGQP